MDLDSLIPRLLSDALEPCLAGHDSCAKLGALCTVTACGNVTDKLGEDLDHEGEQPRLWFMAHPRSGVIAHKGGNVALFVSELFLDDRMPRRLLRVSDDGRIVHLVELGVNADFLKYLALSYCWEGSKFKMTSANRETMMVGIFVHDDGFPATYRNALEVTRRLGFEYL